MSRWSRDELIRTLSEVKSRSMIDATFRKLAISEPAAAIARVNPKPLPAGLSITFADRAVDAAGLTQSDSDLIIVLPPLIPDPDQLSDVELEEAAGGIGDIKFPLE